MLLETMTAEEATRFGVTVYDYRTQEEKAPPQSTLAWQLSQLSADDLGALARQLAQADAGKASMLAEALWSEAMGAEHALLQADDAVMEESNRQAVWGDDDCACQLAATQ